MTDFPKLKEVDYDFLMRAALNDDMAFERKYDGTAAILKYCDNSVTIIGRGTLKDGSQQDYTKTFPELIPPIENEFGTFLGEIVVLDRDGNESFNKLQSRANRKKHIDVYAHQYPATFVAFDVQLPGFPFCARSTHLDKYRTSKIFMRIYQATTVVEKSHMISDMKTGGWEGIVIKSLSGMWGEQQFKYKPTQTQDVFCTGDFVPGKGRNDGLIGSLICYQYINGNKLEVAKVGGGINDELRQELTKSITAGEISEVNPAVIEVQTHELLKSGKLRYPQFIRFRTDKSAEQCVRKM